MESKLKPVLPFLLAHVLVTSLTWRDIKRRPDGGMRGSKRLWRLLSSVNTLGSVGYWTVGRRYGQR